MNTLETLRRAIIIRNDERLSQGESTLTEMWITRETEELFLRDCESLTMLMSPGSLSPGKTTLYGVHLRVIGT